MSLSTEPITVQAKRARGADPAVGEVFGRLTVQGPSFSDGGGKKLIEVLCDCGINLIIRKGNLLSGTSKSCGCLAIEKAKSKKTHGMSGTRMYYVWQNILQRCTLPTYKNYANYGGRGVTVCDRWNTFENFYADVGEPPFEGATLDRIDNDKGYCPENIRWATRIEQSANTRRNVRFEYRGTLYSIRELSDLSKLSIRLITARLYTNNWSVERAVETPVISHSESANMEPETGPGAVKHKLYPTT